MSTTDYINKFKQAIMDRFREVNADRGHVLPQAWLTPYLTKKKNVKHKAFFEPAMQQLQAENLIKFKAKAHYHIKLTQQGEDYLYPNFTVTDAKLKIRNDIFAKFKTNQNKTITESWLGGPYFGRLNPKEQRIFHDVIENLFTEQLVTTSLLKNFMYLTEKGEKLMSETRI